MLHFLFQSDWNRHQMDFSSFDPPEKKNEWERCVRKVSAIHGRFGLGCIFLKCLSTDLLVVNKLDDNFNRNYSDRIFFYRNSMALFNSCFQFSLSFNSWANTNRFILLCKLVFESVFAYIWLVSFSFRTKTKQRADSMH